MRIPATPPHHRRGEEADTDGADGESTEYRVVSTVDRSTPSGHDYYRGLRPFRRSTDYHHRLPFIDIPLPVPTRRLPTPPPLDSRHYRCSL